MKLTPVEARALATAACIAVAGLLAGCGSGQPSARPTVTVTVTAPASSPPAASPTGSTSQGASAPACATSILSGSLGSGGAAAGSTYYSIEFTNTSGSACTLYGYPGVSFVTASGSQVGTPATENTVYPRQLVTLAPGATAHAELGVATAQNYPASTCSPVSVSTLKVYPPGQTAALFLAISTTACSNTSVSILTVQTVQPGTGAVQ
jgi:Protein of unknown function (DUF4232)